MDPVTAITLLAALSELIKVSNSLLGVMKNFKDGENDFHELFNDVCVFEEALKGFDRVLRSRQTRHNISAKVINSALNQSLATIQDLERRLVQISTFQGSAMRRFKWVQNRSKFTKLHERLKEQSAMLQTFLALAHASVTSLPIDNMLTHSNLQGNILRRLRPVSAVSRDQLRH